MARINNFRPQEPPSQQPPVLVRYLRSEFERITQWVIGGVFAQLALYVAKGYGGIANTQQEPSADWGLGWTVVDGWNINVVNEPVSVTQDQANNGLSIDRGGIWVINLLFAVQHDESQQGRYTTLEMRDETNNETLLSFLLYTARNVGGTSFSGSFLIDLPPENNGKFLSWRVGGGSFYTNVVYNNLEFTVTSASEIQDL